MNDGTQINPTELGSTEQFTNPQITTNQPPAKKGNWISIFAGTIVAVAASWGIYQGFYAESASAPVENQQAGVANYNNLKNQPLAKVNGAAITYDQIAAECFSRIGVEVLESVINRVVIQQEVQKRNIIITKAEVQQEVNRIAKQVGLPLDTYYQMLRTDRNISPAQFQRDIVWPKLALQKLAGTDIAVSQQDMQHAFERDFGPRVRCRMIMLDNIRRANEVWTQVSKNPDDFEKYAREHSVEENSKLLGGAFPPIRQHSNNKHLEEAAFRLKTGEISGLIPVGVQRYVILKCEGRTKPLVTNIAEVAVDLKKSLIEEKIQKRVAEVFEQVKKNSRVDNYLTNQTTGSKATTANAAQNTNGNVVPTGGTLTR